MSVSKLPAIVLAAASPRRKDILEELGFSVRVFPSGFREEILEEKNPVRFAMAAAYAKGKDVSLRFPKEVIVSADTVVTYKGLLLGKPANRDEAIRMLKTLSGKTHTVITGLSIFYPLKKREYTGYEKTDVTFRDLTEDEIIRYVDVNKPFDKAGAYGIQNISIPLVSRIDGSYFNVVGFPVSHFYIHWREITTAE
ncbi:MAG: septum formation protein Maf [Candidatus Neomarinimicrobiota bacterium]|nr:MAG: septum formation protein Maf [Candidatus Neomarinimicrobiota bacterium]